MSLLLWMALHPEVVSKRRFARFANIDYNFLSVVCGYGDKSISFFKGAVPITTLYTYLPSYCRKRLIVQHRGLKVVCDLIRLCGINSCNIRIRILMQIE